MGARHPNPRRVKIHRSYDTAELARLFGCHKNTVRAWRAAGLNPIDDAKRPIFDGRVVRAYLERRRAGTKRPCGPFELYCLRCRAPKSPALDMVDYVPFSPTSGNLQGLCPTCEALMFRRVNRAKIMADPGPLDITVTEAASGLIGKTKPSLNCDVADGGAVASPARPESGPVRTLSINHETTR